MPTQINVMISSTSRDLPEYREQAMRACLQADVLPNMMEDLPASDRDAIQVSLGMVDEADVYIGIFAYRYGYVPSGHERSITHMEYDRAVERGIPCLIFVMHEEVPVLPRDFDKREAAEKLEAFKAHLLKTHTVNFFRSPYDLRGQVLLSINEKRAEWQAQEATPENTTEEPAPKKQDPPEDPLPPLPNDIQLPPSPYRRLEWFRREDARVFFGRTKDIKKVYDALTQSWIPPIVLLYGESGVGKSSLLAAGVRPRLEATHEVIYVRRDSGAGLAGTLAAALGTPVDGITAAWHARDETKPLIVILDQVEEAFTHPQEGGEELAAFIKAVKALFETRPSGKLLLGFRKEWIADIESRLTESGLDHHKVFLERLAYNGIVDVVQGPQSSERHQQRYRLTIETGLAGMIAANALKDLKSPVGPTLSILLYKMWEQVKNESAPAFTRELYRNYEAKGLGDYLDEQLANLRAWNEEVVDSGLVLGILNDHVTEIGTAETRRYAELKERYSHRQDVLSNVLKQSKEEYLLIDTQVQGSDGEEHAATRLTHDTLAPLVSRRHRESDRAGQKAERVLQSRLLTEESNGAINPLDDVGLHEVESGEQGMRARTSPEEQLVQKSRAARRWRRTQRNAIMIVGALLVGYLTMDWYNNRFTITITDCNNASGLEEWCIQCINEGGEWEIGGTGSQCVGGEFGRIDMQADFVDIPPGTFVMGSEDGDSDERPVRSVTITKGFKMGKTEVTQEQWFAVVGTVPSFFEGFDKPVERVSWDDVQEFLTLLNESRNDGYTFRLPTEAEWEYACRSGEDWEYAVDGQDYALEDYAWYSANYKEETKPVGTKRPNGFGLYDMSGNVWEWVSDYYGDYDTLSVIDPTGPDEENGRVFRGGSFVGNNISVRCAYRNWSGPYGHGDNLGFRVVALPPSD